MSYVIVLCCYNLWQHECQGHGNSSPSLISNINDLKPVHNTVCDREPIHVPGFIQPHGLLLIVDKKTRTVIGGAGDIETTFGDDWLNSSLDRTPRGNDRLTDR